MNFDNKVAIVTGGSGGIGEALARTFLTKGAKVCLCDVNEADGKKKVQQLKEEFGDKRVIFYVCDVTKDEDFEGAFITCDKELGTVDILCNNAGIYKDVNTTMAVNFFGVVRGTELLFKRIGKHNGGKGGYVVNIASVTGLIRFPCLPYYASSKAATVHYSRCIGHEFNYNYSGVSVLCLCPDAVDTRFSELDSALQGSINSYTDEELKQILPRIQEKLTPMEVAEAVIQLINDNKTGSVLTIEKGVPSFYVAPPLIKEY